MESKEIIMNLSLMTQTEIDALLWFLKRNPQIEKITKLINFNTY